MGMQVQVETPDTYKRVFFRFANGTVLTERLSRTEAIEALATYNRCSAAYRSNPSMPTSKALSLASYHIKGFGAVLVADGCFELPFEMTEEEWERLEALEAQPA